jgi:hypothetical protein
MILRNKETAKESQTDGRKAIDTVNQPKVS